MINQEIYEQIRNTSFQKLISQLSYMRKINNSLYGEGEILLHKQFNIQVVLITKIYNRKEQVNKLEQDAQNRMNLNSNVIRLLSYNVKEIKELCGSFYRFQLIYEYGNYTLLDSIKERQILQKYFNEQEIIDIMNQLINTLRTFKQLSIRHGYIQPKHIIYNNSNLYLTDIRFMTQTTEYLQLLGQWSNECYLSPEQFKELNKNNRDLDQNYEKSEIFSIGITLLYCMNLKYPSIYNSQKFIQNNLNLAIQQSLSRYSIAQMVQKMLSLDLYERISIDDIQLKLSTASILSQHSIQTIKKPPIITPITHLTKSPCRTFQIENEPMTFSKRATTKQPQKQIQQLRSMEMDQCSPFKIDLNQFTTPNTTRSINTSQYEFADDIKMDAPVSLQQEFSKISLNSNYNSKNNYYY